MNERFTDAAAEDMWARPEVVWGLFAVPERDLGVLGDVHGLDVVELACGTAYFSAWLARAGATTVAVDLSGEQLATARRLQGQLGPVFPLVQADAERVPLASGRFDLVVSEHGAAAWCDPERWLPEAARLLRPGGRLVFLTNSHLSALCVPAEEGVAGERLLRGQREAYRVQLARRRDRVPSLARRLGAAAAQVRLRGRGHARDLRAAGRRRPSLLRDRVGRVGDQVAGRGAVGGHPGGDHPRRDQPLAGGNYGTDVDHDVGAGCLGRGMVDPASGVPGVPHVAPRRGECPRPGRHVMMCHIPNGRTICEYDDSGPDGRLLADPTGGRDRGDRLRCPAPGGPDDGAPGAVR